MTDIAHSERAHARLSASGAKQWLACTPSVKLSEAYPDRSSEAARQGTVAHELAEHILRSQTSIKEDLLARKEEWAKIKSSKYFDMDMQEYMMEYTGYVLSQYMAAVGRSRTAGTRRAEIHLETRLDLSRWVPYSFGTGDVTIIEDGKEIVIIDLKYGKGVPVSAVNNPQLRLYALGVLNMYDFDFVIPQVRMVIYQPRLNSVTEEVMTTTELYSWGENYVKPRAILAHRGEGTVTPGEHCVFCKVKNICKARAEMFIDPWLREGSKDVRLMTPYELGLVVAHTDDMMGWAKGIKEFALEKAVAGVDIPGWKLVEGRGKRIITNMDEVGNRIVERKGIPRVQITKPAELISMTDLEKLTGKKWFAENMDDLLTYKPPAPTLVPESDPRPIMQSNSAVASAFGVLPM